MSERLKKEISDPSIRLEGRTELKHKFHIKSTIIPRASDIPFELNVVRKLAR